MTRAKGFCCLLVLGAIGFGLFARAADPVAPAQNDHVLKIGVVDAGKVYDSMSEFRETMAGLQQQRMGFGKEEQKRSEEINDLKKQLEQLREDSPQWNAVRGQILDKSAAIKAQEEVWNLQIQQLQKNAIRLAHRHLLDAAAKVAKDRQLNLVLADSDPDLSTAHLDPLAAQQVAQLVAGRAVLYSDAKADITQEVLARLEADYAAAKAGKAQ
jgi:Skp family chaperone for outer membrane proteins